MNLDTKLKVAVALGVVGHEWTARFPGGYVVRSHVVPHGHPALGPIDENEALSYNFGEKPPGVKNASRTEAHVYYDEEQPWHRFTSNEVHETLHCIAEWVGWRHNDLTDFKKWSDKK